MKTHGPSLEALLRRMAECPPEFLDPPLYRGKGTAKVAAVVSDLAGDLRDGPGGEQPVRIGVTPFVPRRKADFPRLRLVLLACWLIHDDWFTSRARFEGPALAFLAGEVLAELAKTVPPEKFVGDPDRREEFVRHVLAALNLRPEGETLAQAQDRLTTLDSVEHLKVVRATRASRERARRIREALKKKAAEAAAVKASRE